MASTTTLSSPQDSDAWALLALKDATASPARQHRDPIPCEAMEDSINNVVSESICVSATVDNNAGGNSDGGTNSPSNSVENVHPLLQFTERGTSGKMNGHHKTPIAKLKGKEFEFLVRQNRLVIGRNSSTKGMLLNKTLPALLTNFNYIVFSTM